jgi:SAM-dependent methyltransferase
VDVTRENVSKYKGAGSTTLYPAERRIIERFLHAPLAVLELGCGHGRVTKALAQKGSRLTAGDLSFEAVHASRQATRDGDVACLQFDACSLPFKSSSFDVVFFAFNGLDFIHPEAARVEAIKEMARVLKEGGYLAFSSHNPIGVLLSPRGRLWLPSVWRGRLAVPRSPQRPYIPDGSNVLLYHATPRRVVRLVTEVAPMKLVCALERSGLVLPLWLLCLIDPWPHYVFRKEEGRSPVSGARFL